MSSEIKQSAPIWAPKQGGSSPSGKNYIPSGSLLAMILKALRAAQDCDLEIQQKQAQAEQEEDQVLAQVTAKVADNSIRAGKEQAEGLRDTGISTAVNAALTLGVAGYTTGKDAYLSYKSGGSNDLENEVKKLQVDRDRLDEPSEAGMDVTGKNAPTQTEKEISSREEAEATKLDSQEKRTEAKEKLDREIKDKQRKADQAHTEINGLAHHGNIFTQLAGSATQAAGSFAKAPHDAEAAADSAGARVYETLQQMNASVANSFKTNAEESAKAASSLADALAAVANSQVRG